jgi:hypothetical protein
MTSLEERKVDQTESFRLRMWTQRSDHRILAGWDG